MKTAKHILYRSIGPYLQFQNSSVFLFIWWQNLTRHAVMLCLVFISPTEMFCCRNQLCLITHASGGNDIPHQDLREGPMYDFKDNIKYLPSEY